MGGAFMCPSLPQSPSHCCWGLSVPCLGILLLRRLLVERARPVRQSRRRVTAVIVYEISFVGTDSVANLNRSNGPCGFFAYSSPARLGRNDRHLMFRFARGNRRNSGSRSFGTTFAPRLPPRTREAAVAEAPRTWRRR